MPLFAAEERHAENRRQGLRNGSTPCALTGRACCAPFRAAARKQTLRFVVLRTSPLPGFSSLSPAAPWRGIIFSAPAEKMAERQGFEPWRTLRSYWFSKPARSTTPASLHPTPYEHVTTLSAPFGQWPKVRQRYDVDTENATVPSSGRRFISEMIPNLPTIVNTSRRSPCSHPA